MAFTREGLLGIKSKVVTVTVPDYPGEFCLRIMSLAETRAWQKKNAGSDKSQILESLLLYTLCEEDGKRHFFDNEGDVIAACLEFPLVEALADHSIRINKLRKEDRTPEATADQTKN